MENQEQQDRFKKELEQSTTIAKMIELSHSLDLDTMAVMIARLDEWFTIAPIIMPGEYNPNNIAAQRGTKRVLEAARDFELTLRATHNPADPDKPWERLKKSAQS